MEYNSRGWPRAEPRVKQPKKPYKHLWARVHNWPSNKYGTIVEALWDGWHWKLTVIWEGQEDRDYTHSWDTGSFHLYNDIVKTGTRPVSREGGEGSEGGEGGGD